MIAMSDSALHQQVHPRPASILVGVGLGSLIQGGTLYLASITIPKYIHYAAAESNTIVYILLILLMLFQILFAAEAFEYLSSKFLLSIGIKREEWEEDESCDLPAYGITNGKDRDYYSLSKLSAIRRESAETDIYGGAILGVVFFGVFYYSFFH